MTKEQLKEKQTPLKERYKNDPESAVVTLRASGRLGDGVSCSVDTGRLLVDAGLHPATGGSGELACSGDMLLQALVACAGVTLGAVATNLGIELHDAELAAEGDLDFRGTLGVDRTAPVGFRTIRLRISLTSPASDEELAKLVELTERYCVIYQTLRGGVETSVELGKRSD
jgi:uncharacterized OsmC-like protein